jgi:uncharacterized surface protein with fasciclin (FAS1) repeats
MRKFVLLAVLLVLLIAPVAAVYGQDVIVLQPTIADVVASDARFDTLASAVVAAQLLDNLSDRTAVYTVFAPTDDAFAALPATVLTELAANRSLLTRITRYHVVAGYVSDAGIAASSAIETIESTNILVGFDTSGVVLDGRVRLISTDIVAANGIIHVVDAVLVPDLTNSSFFGAASLLPSS